MIGKKAMFHRFYPRRAAEWNIFGKVAKCHKQSRLTISNLSEVGFLFSDFEKIDNNRKI
jgi:hypothetical protein